MGLPLGGYPYGPAARFTLTGIQPPASSYLAPSDQLSLSVLSPNSPINFSLSLRFLDLTGSVQPLLFEVASGPTGTTPFVLPVQSAEGFLLSAACFNASVKRGQCWVQFMVLRQKAADITVVGDVIMQGYVSTTDMLSYPGSPVLSSVEGRGWIRAINFAALPVGQNIQITVPPGVRWRILSLATRYVNTATPVTVVLEVQDVGGSVLFDQSTTFGLNTTWLYQLSWSTSGDFYASNGDPPPNVNQFGGLMPDELYLTPGQTINVFPSPAAGASPTFGPYTLNVEEWVEI
ncbi:MAG TPA: hypothetical protein VGR84_15455 [Candidatus Acidoferrales bacterium]|nr:hypothetical protein [Candidatus Acidoferrales bacterium]